MIDFHVHGLPAAMLPDGFYPMRARALLASGTVRQRGTADELVDRIRQNLDDPDAALLERDLRDATIDHAVLIGIDWGLLDDPASGMSPSEQLDWGMEVVARSEGFFSFVVAVDPRRPEAPEVCRRALDEGAVGIKLYPPMGFWPDDEVCHGIYELAAERGRFVMFHTGRQSYPFDLRYGRLERYSAVQQRWPDLRLVLGHAGATMWGEEAVQVASGHPGTHLEVSGWHTRLDDDEDMVRRFLRRAFAVLGPHRVLFGSDHLSGARSSSKVDGIRRWWQVFIEVAGESGVDEANLDAAARRLLQRVPVESTP